MSFLFKKKASIAFTSLLFCTSVLADVHHDGAAMELNSDGLKPVRADGHAPIGVMGEHMHKKGEWMLSYRYKYMEMDGNRIGTTQVTPAFVTANILRFNSTTARLLVVPTKMTMNMHMFGGMYAPTDWLTLMAMGMYTEKSMDHTTYNAGGTVLGTFNAKAKGLGDTKLSSMINLYNKGAHHLHLNAGVSLPTGSVTKRDDALTPAGGGTIANLRLPYAMQLGSGTYDLLPGITYTAKMNQFSWGAQYMGTFRTGNHNGYTWGDKQEVTSWVSYQWKPWISTSTRIAYSHEEQITGNDTTITAPVQTADPSNYGGDVVMLNLGMNLAGQTGRLRGHRLAAEVGFPLHRDLNGPQLETDLTVTAGWQFAF